ncbi:hypothetical protein [Clostridium sp.]|uniref:hypothetical protein n=1 Tax=Clostridium sp. TaxID=1506 RepID=UPI003F3C80A1
MLSFKNITSTNGFDFKDLNNARQNNYAWAMGELGDYIYVGTGRNVPLSIIQGIAPGVNPPSLLEPLPQDNNPEIWRYKKDGSLPWKRVFKAPDSLGISGFRFMISYNPNGGADALYVASYGSDVVVYKTTNGIDWFLMPTKGLSGTSSRAMVVIKDRLYMATVNEATLDQTPYLFKSKDPEFYPWENVIDTTNPLYDPNKNPKGAISNMAIFNNKLYVATSASDGCQVWRSNGEIPKLNEWTLIVDKGFGDSANKYTLSIGTFKNHLYVSATKSLPLAWAIPMGCDIIRIDKRDMWQLVVGGPALIPSQPTNGVRGRSISGYAQGFSNPFNVYAWQIKEYNGKLLITTFDDSSNMEVILQLLLGNKAYIESKIGVLETKIIIAAYEGVIRILEKIKYPYGFDLYESEDGVHFRPVFKNGLNNPFNYGGRILFTDSMNKLYLGTANPFEGCEVWRVREECGCNNYYDISAYDKMFNDVRKELEGHYEVLGKNMDKIIPLLQG